MIGPSPTSVSAAEGVQAAADGKVVVYFRRGCTFCEWLRLSLGSRRKDVVWVDIWADPEAAAYVRSVNDGNETVPTVVIDGAAHTNPAPRKVKAALDR
ncbi:NrdH-redoxin [Nocardioides panacisoli]|uniref:glutaredoxin domain-containing protein n=1 Tax=Nocardioides panacisoli TaxID=627624 RepID=UPI001C6328BE|nr:glutaredoxin domain-containing protein [Nocardioides panacisoli]QYJ04099.1 NrdH-redoxin [Nocardioides panacisoli]